MHWHAVSAARAQLQQQARAAAQRLQALRLRQTWQLWRRALRQTLAARQRQYSKMMYELLKVCTQSASVPPVGIVYHSASLATCFCS